MIRRSLAPWSLLFALAACSEAPPPPSFPLRFQVRADDAPVAGVRLSARGGELGVTDEDGSLEVTLTGTEGQTVPIAVDCPDDYRDPSEPPRVTLQRLRQLDESRLRRVRIDVECRPRRRTAMLLVRADGLPGVPVVIDGREVVRTDEHGLAHVPLRSAPHTTHEVVLRTEHLDDVLPQNPPHSVTVPDRDEVFVIDQAFTRPEPERQRRRRRRRP
ncbi:MAG TPA: hypothetical protein RMH99_04730, partial [Sandaracinaceae bacterium LLY-WYZ-13_1]|nr:hypothetical protein [Sandaracinaceae bacterium LLY-WYZ-13_1]